MSLITSSDEHTLTIKVFPFITPEQVCASLEAAFKAAAKIDSANQTQYLINMVEKKGIRTGRGFVRIFNPRVYHMILGCNPDGSSRFRRYSDPNQSSDSIDEIFASTYELGQSWADIMDEEDAKEAPMIEEQLPPLIAFAPIRLTPEQRNLHETKAEEISIIFEAALAHDIEDGLSHNVLRSSNLLPHMDEKFIKNEFQCFSTSLTTYSTRVAKGKNGLVQESYPLVKIISHPTARGSERIAYVTFDSSTRDASFAFHMMRCRKYTNSSTKQTFIVSYTYAKSRPA